MAERFPTTPDIEKRQKGKVTRWTKKHPPQNQLLNKTHTDMYSKDSEEEEEERGAGDTCRHTTTNTQSRTLTLRDTQCETGELA